MKTNILSWKKTKIMFGLLGTFSLIGIQACGVATESSPTETISIPESTKSMDSEKNIPSSSISIENPKINYICLNIIKDILNTVDNHLFWVFNHSNFINPGDPNKNIEENAQFNKAFESFVNVYSDNISSKYSDNTNLTELVKSEKETPEAYMEISKNSNGRYVIDILIDFTIDFIKNYMTYDSVNYETTTNKVIQLLKQESMYLLENETITNTKKHEFTSLLNELKNLNFNNQNI